MTFRGAAPFACAFPFGVSPQSPSAFCFRGSTPRPVRFLKRKRSKELETFNMADSLLLCRGHKINKEYKISLLKRIFYSKTLFQHCRADKEHKTDVPKAQNTPLYCSGGYWSPYSHNEKNGSAMRSPYCKFVLFQTLISTPQSSGLLLIFVAVSMCYSSSSVFFPLTFTITDSAL